jgi:hypothetical protein
VWNVPVCTGSFRSVNTFVETVEYASPEKLFTESRLKKAAGESNRRDFTYFVLGGSRFIYASAARVVLIKVRWRLSCWIDVTK